MTPLWNAYKAQNYGKMRKDLKLKMTKWGDIACPRYRQGSKGNEEIKKALSESPTGP